MFQLYSDLKESWLEPDKDEKLSYWNTTDSESAGEHEKSSLEIRSS